MRQVAAVTPAPLPIIIRVDLPCSVVAGCSLLNSSVYSFFPLLSMFLIQGSLVLRAFITGSLLPSRQLAREGRRDPVIRTRRRDSYQEQREKGGRKGRRGCTVRNTRSQHCMGDPPLKVCCLKNVTFFLLLYPVCTKLFFPTGC